ncbi:hypothetical protein M9H77_31074 [Catharanthus roseus]|uniref:Uncharacterized protein n=1 Tax=Catharanthus roseus TaxID=4058 RepID=A0ACC0A0C3_CATRO|nr:hypothetical protein M9H77_31074 [Catharanthus roseus]
MSFSLNPSALYYELSFKELKLLESYSSHVSICGDKELVGLEAKYKLSCYDLELLPSDIFTKSVIDCAFHEIIVGVSDDIFQICDLSLVVDPMSKSSSFHDSLGKQLLLRCAKREQSCFDPNSKQQSEDSQGKPKISTNRAS